MVSLDAERSNLSEYMYFCIKRSFAACPGGRKRMKIWRGSQHKICIIAPSELFTHRNGKFIVLTSPQKNSKFENFFFFEKSHFKYF